MANQIYDASYDPSSTERGVIFIPNAGFARMIKNFKDLGDKWQFYLVPNSAMVNRLELTENKDPDYDNIEDCYVKTIPKKWCITADPFPQTYKIYAMCNWDCKEFVDPFNTKIGQLIKENKRLQRERDAHWETIESLQRNMLKSGKRLNQGSFETAKKMIALSAEANPLKNMGSNSEK